MNQAPMFSLGPDSPQPTAPAGAPPLPDARPTSQSPRPRDALTSLRGLALASHPGPSIAVTVISVVLGLALGLDFARAAVLGLVVFTGQLSIGWSNDWIDSVRDSLLNRADKPIVAGLVSRGVVRACSLLALVTSVALSFALGTAVVLVQLIFLISAWGYNLRLKSTSASWLPYAVSFGLLPLLASLALPEPQLVLPWVIAAGALLGVAAHFANVLPDFAGDQRTGIRGLPHRLGERTSRLIPFILLALVAVLLAVGPMVLSAAGLLPVSPDASRGIAPAASWIIWSGLALGLAISALGIVLTLTRPATRTLMRLIMLGALVDVLMLAFSGAGMLAP